MIYFISFILIIAFIFLNMFIAIILEGFMSSGDDEDMRIQEDALAMFKKHWVNYDPKGDSFISVHNLESLLLDLVGEELKEKDLMMREGSELIENGVLVEGEHIYFDLHRNQMLELCSRNRFKIDHQVKAALGLSEMEIQRQMTKALKSYIAKLHLPTYKELKFYYFYDIIEELAKDVFSNDFQTRRNEDSYKIRNQLRDDIVKSKHLNDLQKEIEEEQLLTDFEEVLEKLDHKATKDFISKYDKMKTVRTKLLNKTYDNMDKFQKGAAIIDSAFIVHGAIIQRYVKDWIQKKRERERLAVEEALKEHNQLDFQDPIVQMEMMLDRKDVGSKLETLDF
mmetsp:Transcript_23030/g.22377  ORF Transcript_23030/g.22377 Transcript_23030/m.22377 type:complete len:338 (-) Transcript_23030:783-1796(-)